MCVWVTRTKIHQSKDVNYSKLKMHLTPKGVYSPYMLSVNIFDFPFGTHLNYCFVRGGGGWSVVRILVNLSNGWHKAKI